MKHRPFALAALVACMPALAEPEYTTVRMEIDVAKPAAEVWARVGAFCDLSRWLSLDCTIVSGDGGIGTVRVLAGGRITEVMVARTALAYGYTQPPREGRFYDLYHGFMEARPTSATTSKIVYTLIYDAADQPDQAAKDADVARRRAIFEPALQNMKRIAEGA